MFLRARVSLASAALLAFAGSFDAAHATPDCPWRTATLTARAHFADLLANARARVRNATAALAISTGVGAEPLPPWSFRWFTDLPDYRPDPTRTQALVFLPYEAPDPRLLTGVWNKLFYYNTEWLLQKVVRTTSRNLPGLANSALRTFAGITEGPTDVATLPEYTLSPFQSRVQPVIEAAFNQWDRWNAPTSLHRTHPEIREAPRRILHLGATVALVWVPIYMAIDAAKEKKTENARLGKIETSPELRGIQQGLENHAITTDEALAALGLFQSAFQGLNEVVRLYEKMSDKDPIDEVARVLAEMAERSPSGPLLPQLTQEQFRARDPQTQLYLESEVLLWAAADLSGHTKDFLVGDFSKIPKQYRPTKLLTSEQKFAIARIGIAQLLSQPLRRMYFEAWKGAPSEAEQKTFPGLVRYYQEGTPALLVRALREKDTDPRIAGGLAVEWEIWMQLFQQIRAMGHEFSETERQGFENFGFKTLGLPPPHAAPSSKSK